MTGQSHRSLGYSVLWTILVTSVKAESQTCHDKFKVFPGHTACLEPSQDVHLAISGVSYSEKREIVNLHNEFRSKTRYLAANMQKMYWDDEVALLAQRWADTCPTYSNPHEDGVLRSIPGRFNRLGQNVAWGYTSWSGVLKAWWGELKDFKYGFGSINGKAIGHYTQMAWATSAKIGCGFAMCGVTRTFVCDYAQVGNIGTPSDPNARYKPYREGNNRCEACPDNCQNGLCDCLGKVCHNGGTLDLNTCKCSCPTTAMGFFGDLCDLNCSKSRDNTYACATTGGPFTKTDCRNFANVAEYCPNMCNICPAGGVDYKGDDGVYNIVTTPPPSTATALQLCISNFCLTIIVPYVCCYLHFYIT